MLIPDKIYFDEVTTIDLDPSKFEQKLKKHESIGKIEHYLREVFHNIKLTLSNLKVIFLPKIEMLKLKEAQIVAKVNRISESDFENKKQKLTKELINVNNFLENRKNYKVVACGTYSELPESQLRSKLTKKTKIENQLRYINTKLDRQVYLQTELKNIQEKLDILETNEISIQNKINLIQEKIGVNFFPSGYRNPIRVGNPIKDGNFTAYRNTVATISTEIAHVEKEIEELKKQGKNPSELETKLGQVKTDLERVKTDVIHERIRKIENNLNIKEIEHEMGLPESLRNQNWIRSPELKDAQQAGRDLEALESDVDYQEAITKEPSLNHRIDTIYKHLMPFVEN